MPKYRVYAVIIGSKLIREFGSKLIGEFEADTAEAASIMASESDGNYVSLCHQCSHEIDEPQIDDSKPYTVEEVK